MNLSEVDLRAPLVEFLSTTAFLYCGLGTAIIVEENEQFFASLVFGFAATALIYMSHHSGAGQLNPLISFALAVSGYMPVLKAALNIAAQFAAGVFASLLLYLTVPDGKADNLGANEIQDGYNVGRAFLAEVVCSYLLQLSVFETMLHPRHKVGNLGPVVVGFIVFAVHGVLVPIDKCSLNPARAFGPALVKNKWDDFWVFFIAPFLGGLLAIPQHLLSLYQKEEKKDDGVNGHQEPENV